jgi:lipopolysaccharide/colanic/teichoic acid biosynthesis glycosyltransferase
MNQNHDGKLSACEVRASGRCTPQLDVRHTVKPGVTGWAAVNGWRGDTSLNERIRFDLELMMQRTACITLRVPLHRICLAAPIRAARLIERWSLLFDAYIMLLTFSRNKNAY